MKIVGIVAEYNPFHLGHYYQLKKARQLTQADVLIVLMSGNVVQRGEFAILDKWQRAELALHYGADLVIESPLVASLQGADYFAAWSIRLLAKTGCTQVVFGTESASIEELQAFIQWEAINEKEIQTLIQTHLQKGYSYVASLSQSIEQLQPNLTFDYSSGNHTLGISYMRTNQTLEQPLEMLAIPRISRFNSQLVLSGSEIRARYFQRQLTKDSLPPLTDYQLQQQEGVIWSDYWLLLKYQLATHTPESLQEIFGVREGIEYLLLKKIKTTTTFDHYLSELTSKRWTKSSLQRILLAILLNITKHEWSDYISKLSKKPTARILGFNSTGREYLKLLRGNEELELFANLSKRTYETYHLMVRADDVFELNPLKGLATQNQGRYPIILND